LFTFSGNDNNDHEVEYSVDDIISKDLKERQKSLEATIAPASERKKLMQELYVPPPARKAGAEVKKPVVGGRIMSRVVRPSKKVVRIPPVSALIQILRVIQLKCAKRNPVIESTKVTNVL